MLGQGGFGITYLAQDFQTKGRVAIKEFFPDTMASRTSHTAVTPYTGERGENFAYGLNSFLEEAKTMAEFIGNPNITRVDSYFEENGTGYFVMEYLEGDSFLGYIQAHGGRITWDETMNVVLPVMNALAAMHEKGIIHRDVTPDNIYITKDGTVKLLDFGAARYSLGNVSRSLDVILKHGFAPYEQYSRRGKQGPFTDVYALGATIYYAITGVKPDDAIERRDEDNTPLPTTLGAKITDAQEAVVMRALAVLPNDRYQNIPQFRAALTAAQPVPEPKPKPEPPKPEPPKPEPPKPERPDVQLPDPPKVEPKKLPKWVLPVAAAVVVLCGIGLGVKSSQQKKLQEEARLEAVRQEEAQEAARLEAAREEEARLEAAREEEKARQEEAQKAADYQQAQGWLDAGEFGKAIEAFEILGPYQDSAEKADMATREQAYQQAQALMDDGKYFQAMRTFSELDYKDSAEKAQAAKEAYWAAQRSVPLSAGNRHTVGLHSDGSAVATQYIAKYSDDEQGQCKIGWWKDMVALSAGLYHTVGLRSNGTVVATKFTSYYYNCGQCHVEGWKDIVAISAGDYHTVGLRSDGTVVATKMSDYDHGQCDVSGWTDIVAVSAGNYHTVGLRSDGTVVAVGWNPEGECNVNGWKDIVAISTGYDHTVGLRSDGTVVATEYTGDQKFYYGQCDVSGWTDIVAVSAGGYHTVGLRSDGTVVATGYNGSGGCDVSGWTDIVAISAGSFYTVGLRSDGTVVATKYIGEHDYGQCDVGDWTDIRIP